MNKTYLIAWLVVFVVWFLGSYLVHGLLLQGDYMGLPELFRTPEESAKLFPLMILAHVIMAGAFVWLYARGVEDKPWIGQGLRFGAAIALLAVVPMYTIYYVVQPMPGGMAVKQIVYDAILVLVLGVVAAYFYRGRARA